MYDRFINLKWGPRVYCKSVNIRWNLVMLWRRHFFSRGVGGVGWAILLARTADGPARSSLRLLCTDKTSRKVYDCWGGGMDIVHMDPTPAALITLIMTHIMRVLYAPPYHNRSQFPSRELSQK